MNSSAAPDHGVAGSPGRSTPSEPLGRLVSRIGGKAVPLYLSMLSTMVGSMVTAGVLGNTGTAELAAYALVIAVFTPTLMVVQGALRGSMPFVAENEEDPESLVPVVRDSTWLAVLLGLLGGLLIVLVPVAAPLVGVADATAAAFGVYPLLMGLYVVIAAVKGSMHVLLIGLGKNRTVLVLSLVTTGLAVILTPSLVLGPGPLPQLGLAGAGAAMLIDGLATTALALYLAQTRTVLRGHPVGVGLPRWPGIRAIARVGLPTGSTLLIKSLTLSVLALAAARLSATDAAAHQLLIVIVTFTFIPAVATGQSTIPFTARALSAGDRTQVRRTVVASHVVSVPVIALSMVAVWTLSTPAVGLFTNDPSVQDAVVALIPILFAVVASDALQALPGMGLVGIKNTRPSLYAFVVCYGLLSAAALPLAEYGGLPLLWTAYAVTTAGLFVSQNLAFWCLSGRIGSSQAR